MKNILKVIFVIIGTLIGAGFASGREIYLFFGKYGKYGKIGIILSGILTGIIIYRVLELTKMYEINTYNKLLERINWKHNRLNKFINIIVNAFLLISFYIMIAGFSAYIAQTYGIAIYISSSVFVIISYIIFKKSIQGVIKANEVLVPILISLIIYLGIKNIPYMLSKGDVMLLENNKGWLFSSILYSSYNSILLIPVLTSLRNYIDSKKGVIKISVISSVVVIILAFLIYGLLLRGEYFYAQLEMPLIEITMQFGRIFKYIYGFVIIASIFTSAISAGYSFLGNVSKSKKSYNIILLIMCLTGILVSNIGFSNLVEMLYPLFGVLGLIQIWMIFKFRN